VVRDNIADRGFDVQFPRHMFSFFVQDTRAVTVSFCDRVNEPVNLTIELAEPQFEVSALRVRLG
jgi:hypothetical protein